MQTLREALIDAVESNEYYQIQQYQQGLESLHKFSQQEIKDKVKQYKLELLEEYKNIFLQQ